MASTNAISQRDLPQLGWLERYWTKSWLRRHSVTVRTCRLFAQDQDNATLFRITYLAARSDSLDTERSAEKLVSELIRSNVFGSTTITEVQWRRARLVTVQTLLSESEEVLKAIRLLQSTKATELVVYDRLDQYHSTPSPHTPRQSVPNPT